MREVESKSRQVNRQYLQLQGVLQYLLGEQCTNAFNGVPAMAVGSPAYIKYHAASSKAKGKSAGAAAAGKGKDGLKKIEIMKNKADRHFVKNQLGGTEDSIAKFSELEHVLVGKTRNRIRPIENKESAKVRSECIQFNSEMELFTKAFHSVGGSKVRQFWGEDTEVDVAFQELEKGEVELVAYRKALKGWQRMVSVFDHDGLVDGAEENLNLVEATLADMKKLWGIRRDVVKVNAQTAEFMWEGMNPDDLEDISKEMQKMVRKLPRTCRKNPAFKGLNNRVRDFSNTVPLIGMDDVCFCPLNI